MSRVPRCGWGCVGFLVKSQVSAKALWRPDFLQIQVTMFFPLPVNCIFEVSHSLQSLGAISGVLLASRLRGHNRILGSGCTAIAVL